MRPFMSSGGVVKLYCKMVIVMENALVNYSLILNEHLKIIPDGPNYSSVPI